MRYKVQKNRARRERRQRLRESERERERERKKSRIEVILFQDCIFLRALESGVGTSCRRNCPFPEGKLDDQTLNYPFKFNRLPFNQLCSSEKLQHVRAHLDLIYWIFSFRAQYLLGQS